MRYFSYIAEQSFKTSETGQRLFYHGGPWTTPYVMPDLETEKRILKKQTWIVRIGMSFIVLSLSVVFTLKPKILDDAFLSIMCFAVVMAAYWAFGFVVLAPELKGIKRADAKPSLEGFYFQTARKHSRTQLVIGLIGSMLFVIMGLWLFRVNENWVLGLIAIVIFGLAAFGWGYALSLKSKSSIE